jgi:hypothetical protein
MQWRRGEEVPSRMLEINGREAEIFEMSTGWRGGGYP